MSTAPRGTQFVRLGNEVVDVVDLNGGTPKDRAFRDAWRLQGQAVKVDIPAAVEIAKEKIRQERAPLFTKLDSEFAKAQEGRGGDVKVVGDRRQKLRDATADQRLTKAKTPEELKAALEAVVEEMKAV